MSYSKKDEDADSATVKVDRTSVFQEGKDNIEVYSDRTWTDIMGSPSIQHISSITTKMSDTSHQDSLAPVHWRKVSQK